MDAPEREDQELAPFVGRWGDWEPVGVADREDPALFVRLRRLQDEELRRMNTGRNETFRRYRVRYVGDVGVLLAKSFPNPSFGARSPEGRCARKKAYRSRMDALLEMTRPGREARDRFHAVRTYRCPHCGKWHLTSDRHRR